MKMQEIAGSEQILDAEIVLIAAGFWEVRNILPMLSGWN